MLLYVNRYKWVVDWIFVIVRAIPLYTTFYIVSIHLMLLFIEPQERKEHLALLVSIHLMLLFICIQRSGSERYQQFQYISCYSLSIPDVQSHLRMPLFQYISCYSLSGSFKSNEWLSNVSIHLMLLFICFLILINCHILCFNTSHVTLYQ